MLKKVRRWMEPRGRGELWGMLAIALPLAIAIAVTAHAQSRLYYFNGVTYVFPASQGAAGQVLTNDGTGTLSWSAVPTPEGLWSGAVVLSSSSCPAGWTRLSAADGRFIRAAATAGGTGGADTHTHTLTGSTASQGVTISGNTASSSVSISGSTGTTSINHGHSLTTSTATAASGGTSVITSVSVNATDPSHSHGAGTLAGGSHNHGVGSLAGASHTHGAGSLAAGSASNVPAYYTVVVCVKD